MPLREISQRTYDMVAKAAEDFANEFQTTIISDTVKEIIENSTPIHYNDANDTEIIDEKHLIELNNMVGRSAKDLTNDAIKGQIIKTKFNENELATNFLDSVSQAAEGIVRREALHKQNWFIEQIKHSRIPDATENYELFVKKLNALFKTKSFSLEGLEQMMKTQLELAKSYEAETIIENIKERVKDDIEEAEVRQNEIVTVMQEVQDTAKEYDDEITEESEDGDLETEPVEDETDSELKIPDDGVDNALDNNDNLDVNIDDGSSNEAILKKQVAMNSKKTQAEKLAAKLEKARASKGASQEDAEVDIVNNKGKDPDSGPDVENSEDVGKVDEVDDVFKEYVTDDDPASQEEGNPEAINEGESDEDLASAAKSGAAKTKEVVGTAAKKAKEVVSKASTSLKNKFKKSKENQEAESPNSADAEAADGANPGAGPEGVGAMSTYQNRDNFGSANAQTEVPDSLENQAAKELSEDENVKYQFGPGDKENPQGKKIINPLRGTGAETENNGNVVENPQDTSVEVLKRLVPLSEIKFTQDPIYTPRSISAYLYRIGTKRPEFIDKVEKRLKALGDIISNSHNAKGLMKKFNKLQENWKKGQEQAFLYDIEISNMGLAADKINSREDLFTLAVAKNIINRYHLKGSGYKLRRVTKSKDLYKKSIEKLVDHIFTYYYFAHRLDKAKDITFAKEGLAIHEEKINGAIYDLKPEDRERCVNLKNLLADGQLNRLFVTDSLLIDFNNIFSRVKDTTNKPVNMLADADFREKVLSNLEKKNLNITESMESILDTLLYSKADPTSINPPIFTSIVTNLSKKHIAKSAESIASKENRAKIYTEAKVYLTIKRAAEALGLNNLEFEQAFAKEFMIPVDISGYNE